MTTKPPIEPLRPHSELFRTEKNELIEVEWLIVTTKAWHAGRFANDPHWRVRPLPGGSVLALRANA
jgi:hypothetical protein